MKKLIVAIAMFASAAGAMAQTNLSLTIGQPGFYGRLDVGDFGRPQVVYDAPVIIQRSVRYEREPLYLRVPPGHMKKWGKHCSRYNACGRQVYFVKDEWYNNTYAPRYRETRGWRDDGNRGDRGDRPVVRNVVRNVERGGTVYFDSGDDGRGKGHGGGKHDKHDKGDKGHGKGNGKHKD